MIQTLNTPAFLIAGNVNYSGTSQPTRSNEAEKGQITFPEAVFFKDEKFSNEDEFRFYLGHGQMDHAVPTLDLVVEEPERIFLAVISVPPPKYFQTLDARLPSDSALLPS